jgi:4-amino-4-deoxy-L-arabinose transferase-like glycosyltransferase
MELDRHRNAVVFWALFAAAAASLLTTLGLPYVGEEGVYTITSMEMWANRQFFVTTLYGTNYGRPPLINWLIIPLANLLGWNSVLTASRLVTAGATVATGLVLAWLALQLTRDRAFAAFCAAAYMSGDVLFYRGWLAYSDSLFTLGVFSAIACAWVAAVTRRTGLLWIGIIALTGGVLAKTQTAYLFYGVALAVLAFDRERRSFLLSPGSLLAHAAALGLFLAWHLYLTAGLQASATTIDILLKFSTVGLADYLNQLWSFPVETFLRFLPASALAAYFWFRLRREAARASPTEIELPLVTLAAILVLNYLPYWLGPKTHIRYVMPLYPLATLFFAYVIWIAGAQRVRIATWWLVGAVVLKYVLALWAFPAYQEKYRGHYAVVAAAIETRTAGFPLYATDTSATGLSVVAHLDQKRMPRSTIAWPPEHWNNGFVLSYTPDPSLGQVTQRYQLGGNEIFLLCRGPACAVDRR